MKKFISILRMIATMQAMLIAAFIIVLFALIPIRIRGGVPLPIYPVIWFAHYFMAVFNIRYTCTDREKLLAHSGLLVFNHLSYVDILTVLHTVPTRFMATVGIKKIPVIGWVGNAIGTIFVNRGDKDSRAEARAELGRQLQERPFPPLGLFPEGRIGDGTTVRPFRHGAFDVAITEGVDCLPCALRYEPFESFSWTDKNESLPQALWRLATAEQTHSITVIPLDRLDHREYDDAATMAEAAHTLIATALQPSS